MANQKVSIPKGTRDFTPSEMVKRNYIFDTIRKVYKKYGFQPIETPAMENLSTLLGKYGDEGDKLLFKILNNGDFTSNVSKELKNNLTDMESEEFSQKLLPFITEKGLRYDLTVPFARFVVQHQNEIQFPFKRYQIQPVWRADRPQKGRYREFFQCDADIVGSSSLINEAELLQIINDVFKQLNINVTVKLNNRKILAGIAEAIDSSEQLTDITVAIDKLDKIGIDNVKAELISKGIESIKIEKLLPIILLKGNNTEKLDTLKHFFSDNNIATGLKGISELEEILTYINALENKTTLEIDISLARGLNYYTGAIIEIKANDVQIGSICGGGRYDDLTGIFGLPNVSGVGISFGADRIYDVLEQLNGFPKTITSTVDVMFVNFGVKEATYCLPLLKELHIAGYSAIIYPDATKMKKQMSYANALNIPYVVLAGENEINEKKVTIKDMVSGTQENIEAKNLVNFIGKN